MYLPIYKGPLKVVAFLFSDNVSKNLCISIFKFMFKPLHLVAFHPIRGHDVVGTSGLIFSCHDAINIGGQGSDVKQGSTFKSLLIKKTI